MICAFRLCSDLLRVSSGDGIRAGVTSEDELEASSSLELGVELAFVVTKDAILTAECLMLESMSSDVV